MPNVFEGTPDARQSADVAHPVSRFRPTYRALTDAEKLLHDELKIQGRRARSPVRQGQAGQVQRPRGHQPRAVYYVDRQGVDVVSAEADKLIKAGAVQAIAEQRHHPGSSYEDGRQGYVR